MGKFEQRLKTAFDVDSISSVADRLGEKYHTVRNWAVERIDIPSRILAKIATLTGVNLTWLLTGEGEQFATQQKTEIDLNLIVEDLVVDIVKKHFGIETKPALSRPKRAAEGTKGIPSFSIGEDSDGEKKKRA